MKNMIAFFDRLSPSKRRIINVIIVLLVAVGFSWLLLGYLIPYLTTNSSLATKSVTEAVASIAVVATVTVTAINLVVASMNKRYSSKKQLSLVVTVKGSKAIITSTIENKGSDRITPKSFYLFINSGVRVEKDGAAMYEFPNILKHECGEFDCSLAKKCKAARVEKIPDDLLGEKFKNAVSICRVLNHIAADSVNFIDPGEIFSEDTIFELPSGVYRVILLGISVEADCMCAHKVFVIE